MNEMCAKNDIAFCVLQKEKPPPQNRLGSNISIISYIRPHFPRPLNDNLPR